MENCVIIGIDSNVKQGDSRTTEPPIFPYFPSFAF